MQGMQDNCCSGAGCGCSTSRNFPTKQEKMEMLKDYQKALENEIQGVKEKIKELEKKE